MLYKGRVIPKNAIKSVDVRLIYMCDSFSKLNRKDFTNIDSKSQEILTNYLKSLSNRITEFETFQIDDEEIIKILNKEYSNTQHYYSANSTYEEIIYERVEDQDGNIYAKELLTGSIFPIECDGSIETKVYTVKRLVTNAGTVDYCDLSISSDSNHSNYARIERIVTDYKIVSPKDVEEYKTQFDGGFRRQKAKEKFLRKIREDSMSNTLLGEVEVYPIKPKKKEKRQRESQNTITISMENIEYMISRLESINPERSKYYGEEYERALNSMDIMQNKTVSESALISLEAKLEFELMFTKGENTTLVEKLEELRKEYLLHLATESQEKTSITLDDLDKLMELFLKTKDTYSILEQRKILRNFATIYTLEVKENENEVDFDRLKDSYFNDLRKSILLSIKSLIQTGLFKSNIQFELSTDESIENILELIRNLEIENAQEESKNCNQKNLKMSEKITFYT